MKKILSIAFVNLIILLIFPHFLFAETGHVIDWQYFKIIQVRGSTGYKAVYLDEDVYLNSQSNLADLRIINDKGEFIPYFIKHYEANAKATRINHDTTFLSSYSLNDATYMQFLVLSESERNFPKGNILSFTLPDHTILGKVEIYGGHKSYEWSYLGKGYLYNIGSFSSTDIILDQIYDYKYYQIKVPKQHNLPQPIKNPKLIYDPLLSNPNAYTTTFTNYIVKNDPETNTTIIKMAMPKTTRIQVSKIHFDIKSDHVRKYTLETQDGYRQSGQIYKLVLNNTEISSTVIEFPKPISTPLITITVENRDDVPLSINKILITYITDKLVFELDQPSKRTYLLFGNPTAVEPFYDFMYYQQIFDNTQNICTLGMIENNIPVTLPTFFSYAIENFNFVYLLLFVLLSILMIWVINQLPRVKKKRRYRSF